MKAIDLSNIIMVQGDEEIIYPLKENLIEVLFTPAVQNKAVDIIRKNEIAKRILEVKLDENGEGELMLDDADFKYIKESFDKSEGFRRHDDEMINRVLNAKDI